MNFPQTRKRVALLCLALCVLLFLPFAGCRKRPTAERPLTPGLFVIEGVAVGDADVALRTDRVTVTPGMLAYFFYSYGVDLIGVMEQNKAFDESKNLHDQEYADGVSWYDTLMNAVLASVTRMMIFADAAAEEGFALNEAQETAIENTVSSYRFEAAAGYSMTLDDYLKRNYGERMNERELRAALTVERLAAAYSDRLNAALEEGITPAEARAYAEAHGISDETPSRNAAFVAVTGEATAITEKAAAALAAIRANPTESTVLAQTAQGSVGTLSDMIPENTTVPAISAWLFDSARRVGDSGIATAEGVSYVLLYTGNGAPRGEVYAKMYLYDEVFAAWYNARVAATHFGYNYDVIDSYDVG